MGKSTSSRSRVGSNGLSKAKTEIIETKKKVIESLDSTADFPLKTVRRRSERLSKSATCNLHAEKPSVVLSGGKSLLPKIKTSDPGCSVSRRKTIKSGSRKPPVVVGDDTSSGSGFFDDSDEDWKPNANIEFADEAESEVDSLDDFRSILPDEVKPKKAKIPGSYSSLSSKSVKTTNKAKTSHKFIQKSTKDVDKAIKSDSSYGSDTDEPSEWEDVEDKVIPEEDYLKNLLDPPNGSKFHDSVEQSKTSLSLEVPLFSSKKVTKKDPKILEQMAIKRRLRERYYAMHLTHLMCFLAYSRRLNQACDSPLYRALGLSLLSRVGILFSKKGEFIAKSKWGKEHLEACIVSILIKQDPAIMNASNVTEMSKSTLLVRLRENRATETDCTILLVAALRALAFDVRIVVGINPYPIKPDSSFAIPTTGTRVNKVNGSKIVPTKVNRQIISSSETDNEEESEKPKHRKPSKTKALKQVEVFCFAEVFLPSLNQWITIDPSPPNGYVGKLGSNKSWLYCIGLTSTSPIDDDSVPYVGRNPIDLAARYDPDWCIRSRPDRVPADKWSNLLNFQKSFFDRDALSHKKIVNLSKNPVTYQRDSQDERAIRERLLSEPIPERLPDLKNHPLYVLRRHLLKYQIIYPLDAVPLGFFKDEPVYSRDCVKLCHNRESWLKEAMVVKPLERPVKVVKARPSMKRKLLQGYGDKPQTVELFGPWQVEPYKPPVAENGIVPRGQHGTVDLFKPCMLPIGCTHICLTGIQHIAKKLGIDCVPAVVGWTFHGAGWAHPKQEGYIVCSEAVPALVDAWHESRMNAAKAAAVDRTERVLENWRRLVRGLFLWHRIKAQFALAPLHSNTLDDNKSNSKPKKAPRKAENMEKAVTMEEPVIQENLHKTIPTVDSCLDNATSEGWQRLSQLNEVSLPRIPIHVLEPAKKRPKRAPKRSNKTKSKGRKKKASSPSFSEGSEEDLPSSHEDSDNDFV